MNTSIFCFRSLSAQARPKARKHYCNIESNERRLVRNALAGPLLLINGSWILLTSSFFYFRFLSLSLVFLLLLYSWNTLIAEQRFVGDVSFRFEAWSAAASTTVAFDGGTFALKILYGKPIRVVRFIIRRRCDPFRDYLSPLRPVGSVTGSIRLAAWFFSRRLIVGVVKSNLGSHPFDRGRFKRAFSNNSVQIDQVFFHCVLI